MAGITDFANRSLDSSGVGCCEGDAARERVAVTDGRADDVRDATGDAVSDDDGDSEGDSDAVRDGTWMPAPAVGDVIAIVKVPDLPL